MEAASSAEAAQSDTHGRLVRQQTISSAPTLTNGVIAAWNARCGKLGEDERRKFESRACRGLAEYLTELSNACQEYRDESRAFRFVDWFEPLYTAVELFMPAATVAVQAYPSPGSLILGGVIAALEATQRLRAYHKLTVQLLARMGRKAHILQAYETVVYQSDEQVQRALVEVYGDMIDFCQNATKLATKHKKTIVKVKGFMMSIFKDFEAQLGSFAQAFETHVEDLEALGRLRDKKRLKDLHDLRNAHYLAVGEGGGDSKDQLQRLGTAMDQLLKRNREIERQEEEKAKEGHRAALLDWLSPMSFVASYDQRCDEHLDGTGTWMLSSEAYTNWKSSDQSDLLWVKGKPGCGKSVLAAVVVTDLKLEVEPDTALGYAFCRRDEESSQDPTTIFGALTGQISAQMPGIHPVLENEGKASHTASKPSLRAIRQIMTSVAKEFKRIYLVVDALDECKDNEELAQELRDLVENKGLPPVKIIVFSRVEYKIDQRLGRYKQIEPDQGANEEDLKAYIRFRFPKTKDEKSINSKIRKECFVKADGMFLWVQLLAKNLRDSCLPDKEKLKLIQKIPHGLDSIYDRILDGICGQTEYSRKTAFLVLLWVMFAWRPLSRREMLEAVADYSEARKLKEATRYDNAEHLVAVCANLVFIDRNGHFRLCHESARTHLEKLKPEAAHPLSKFQNQTQNAHQRLAEICLNYLLLDDFERGIPTSLGGLLKFAERKPFLDYASNWDLHVNKENASALHSLIMKCINSQPRRELSIQFALVSELGESEEALSNFKLWMYTGTSNPLHRLALSGLKQVAMKVPEAVSLALQADGSGKTPLEYAVERRHHDMTVWLVDEIQRAPVPLLSMKERLSLVHSAAQHGWPDLLETLLSGNKDLANLKMSHDGETPLGQACKSGSKEAAEALIRHGASVNLIDGKGDCPLLLAAIYGHASIVHMLLAHDADPNCCDPQGFGPLFYAADIGNAEIATALLEKHADPLSRGLCGKKKSPLFVAAYRNSADVLTVFHKWNPRLLAEAKHEDGLYPQHGAAFQNSFKALQYLLENGVAKDGLTEDAQRETALHIAADMGFIDSVKVLVDAGCDPDLPDAKGRNAVHAGALSGKPQVVQYILDKQPRAKWSSLVNRRSNDGETPLHSAVHGENAGIVTLLLERGSNPEQEENEASSTSPLHWAAEKGLTVIADTLLEHTKQANPRNSAGETPLHFAAKTGKSQFIVQFFQKARSLGIEVDVNAKSNTGGTALHLALVNGFEQVAEFLLQQGALSFCNKDGNYPIHLAAWQGYDSIVQKLVSHEGADTRGYHGRTALHCAAYKGHLSTVKLLSAPLAHVVNVPDEQDRTPVLSSLLCRHLDVAHHLLDMGVDTSGTGNYDKVGLLHLAAWIPDVAMTKRLLALGVRGDQRSRFGAVPMHHAARSGSTEVIDALVAAGFNDVDALDSVGTTPAMYAAEEGELDALRRLDELGTAWQLGSELGGKNAAHFAADKSHPDVMKFLASRGIDLGQPDDEGCTPLMNAACEGNAAVVSYLLQTQAHAVNYRPPFKHGTALTMAAKNGYPRCVQALLAAGADPHIPDMYGISALEYAAFHRPCLREMHNARHLRVPVDMQLRKKILFNLICQLCEMIPQSRSGQQYNLVSLTCSLSVALIVLGDYEAVRPPLVEILWPPEFAVAEVRFMCTVCRTEKFLGDKYVCQTCLDWTCMCRTCHTEFETAKSKIPESLREVMELEKRLVPVRLAVLQETSLFVVTGAMRRFIAGCDWTRNLSEEYELWEQKHNSSQRFQALMRPGQELLKLVMEFAPFIDGTATATDVAELTRTAMQLQDRYEKFVKKHGFIKDMPDFRCEDHKFMLITDKEAKEVKAAGVDLGPDGRMSDSYFERLAQKYKKASADLEATPGLQRMTSGGGHAEATKPGAPSRDGSSASLGGSHMQRKAAAGDISAGGAAGLRRSLTIAVRQRPPKRPLSLKLPSHIEGGRDASTPDSPFTPVDRSIHGVRRAQTLPAGYGEDLANNIRSLSLSEKRTLCAEPEVPPHPHLVDLAARQEVGVSASRVADLSTTVTLSMEPEEIGDSAPTAATTNQGEDGARRPVASSAAAPAPARPPQDITAETTSKNDLAVMQISVQLMFAGLDNGQTLTEILANSETTAQLAFTLHVTASMVPGFVDLYLNSQRDEHELAKENEELAATSSFSDSGSESDGSGSDSDGGGDGDSGGEDEDSEGE